MACTTLLVGKKASYDGSTIIARNDDSCTGVFNAKKLIVVNSKDQPRDYKSVIAHLTIKLPNNPLSYTSCPNVDKKEGTWAASGINSENVSMTATETITTNPLVLGMDPLVRFIPRKGNKKEIPGGIGEEDLVVITLPYIHSAKEGAIRLGSLLEKYGTYENNGIAFSDKDEIWWLETIGGHNWIAHKVKDNEYVVMPNQFGLDNFDFDDAYGAQKEYLCSKGLKDLVEKGFLNLNLDKKFNPRLAFGSHDDSDHFYNTPRAWFMLRYFNPNTYKWNGCGADFAPEDDDLPWSMVPERKITIEDVKYILSSHYQGTPYDPYSKDINNPLRNKYRSIGISRTSFLSINQIRGYLPKEIAAIEWICFGSNAFNSAIPFYTNVNKMPKYVSNTTLKVSTDNFYWNSRMIGAFADAHYNLCALEIERYQKSTSSKGHELLNKYDKNVLSYNKFDKELLEKANEVIANMAMEETAKTLDRVLYISSCNMKNSFSRSDN